MTPDICSLLQHGWLCEFPQFGVTVSQRSPFWHLWFLCGEMVFALAWRPAQERPYAYPRVQQFLMWVPCLLQNSLSYKQECGTRTPLTSYQLILRIVVSPPHHNEHIHPLIFFITLLHNSSRPGVFHDHYVYCCVFILSGAVFSYWWLCVVA